MKKFFQVTKIAIFVRTNMGQEKCLAQKLVTGNMPKQSAKVGQTLVGHTVGVLTHTTAWDQLQGDDETLKCGFKIKYTSMNE